MVRYVIGIDPGATGALALIALDNGNGAGVSTARVIALRDIPVSIIPKAGGHGSRRRVSPAALTLALRELERLAQGEPVAWVEHVHASPGMGVSSAFSFGHTAGVIEACLSAVGIRGVWVAPSVWKPALAVPADKVQAVACATRMFGTAAAATYWSRKMDHNRAEAALIGAYGARAELADDISRARIKRARGVAP